MTNLEQVLWGIKKLNVNDFYLARLISKQLLLKITSSCSSQVFLLSLNSLVIMSLMITRILQVRAYTFWPMPSLWPTPKIYWPTAKIFYKPMRPTRSTKFSGLLTIRFKNNFEHVFLATFLTKTTMRFYLCNKF